MNNRTNSTGTGAGEAFATVNREYKSDVFKMYFSIKKNALELYNAMNGTAYTNEDDLVIDTLENAVFMKIYNDVSFVISGTVNLYEHQATINPNMPLRDLFYIADMYKRYVMDADLYGRACVNIPTPKFAVFYNGVDDIPDKETRRLSDSFQIRTDSPEMELKVQVLNINYGHNRELMEKCAAIKDYAIFNARVRGNLKNGLAIEEAVSDAVDSCISDHVMEDFLIREKAGVIKMHILDFNEERHNASLKAEGREDAYNELICRMLTRGKTPEEIADLCGVTLETVIEISDKYKCAQTS